MEERKEYEPMGSKENGIGSDCSEKEIERPKKSTKQIHHLYLVKFYPSPEEHKKEEADMQYQLMNLARSHINEEIDQRKGDQHQINKKLMWFSLADNHIDWKMQEIENLERYDLSKEEPRLQVHIGTERKHFQKRLKKERINMEYLLQVQEDVLSSKKSGGMTMCGKEELNDLIKSLVQRIQHGNNNRIEEIKLYQELKRVTETRETYTALEPDPTSYWWSGKVGGSKRDTDWKRAMQHKINIRLDDIEKIKRDQEGRKARVTRLKAELEHVRRNITSLEKEFEHVNAKRLGAYKLACDLGEQKNELKSSYGKYQTLITNAKDLARKGDVVGLKGACDRQVEEFMRKWSNSKTFRNDYERRKLSQRLRTIS